MSVEHERAIAVARRRRRVRLALIVVLLWAALAVAVLLSRADRLGVLAPAPHSRWSEVNRNSSITADRRARSTRPGGRSASRARDA